MLAGPSRTSQTDRTTRSRLSLRVAFAGGWSTCSCAFPLFPPHSSLVALFAVGVASSLDLLPARRLTHLSFCSLVVLLRHPSTSVQTPALRSVGNIVTGDDLQTQVIIASGALSALLSLLQSPKEGIRKEACWTISNITAGSTYQIQAIIDANIVPPLIQILGSADFKTKKEACWALSNATSGGLQEPSQIRYLVSQGCIKPLCDLLKTLDNKIIQVA